MKKIKTLEEALQRIAELEKANAELREELEYFKKRKASGRQKHNAKWVAIYEDFVLCHEKGMTLAEIAERNGRKQEIELRVQGSLWRERKKKTPNWL